MKYFQPREDAPKRMRDRIARQLAKLFFSFMVMFVDKDLTHHKLYSYLLNVVGYDVQRFNLNMYDKSEIIKAVMDVQSRPIEITDSKYKKIKKSKQHLRFFIDNKIRTSTNSVLTKIINSNES